MTTASSFDAIVIGAGVGGNAMACALADSGKTVGLIERDWKEPDRIVGELLQAGGMTALIDLGLKKAVEDIDAIVVEGYGVILKEERQKLPYPLFDGKVETGRSFHHGRFIMKLREESKKRKLITPITGIAKEFIETNGVVSGVRYRAGESLEEVFAPLTFVIDGCYSNFRKFNDIKQPTVDGHFVGVIIENCTLPYPNHGHVILADPSPVLAYQIGSNETRILVDVPGKLPPPSELKEHLLTHTAPQLPPEIKPHFIEAVNNKPIRSHSNSTLHPDSGRAYKPGVIFLGDSWNMRHPLTGGGMTVLLKDIYYLHTELKTIESFKDSERVSEAYQKFLGKRIALASTVNILAKALYGVFGAAKDDLLTKACWDYFKLGGRCVSDPMTILAGKCETPSVLITHFFLVALYGVYRTLLPFPTPWKLMRAWRLISTASWIVIPLMKGEKMFTWFASALSLIFYK